ncbi:hypothetical protein Bca52824_063287 [Brassica carinata]|uniref:Uncharacterized protein n=1 Tax=Brassica carinata TaxID=52824 RepID=A0A8X7QEH5_BRACI|nr:hypothetical protein Bca52824_063287 [Brassica carinata]
MQCWIVATTLSEEKDNGIYSYSSFTYTIHKQSNVEFQDFGDQTSQQQRTYLVGILRQPRRLQHALFCLRGSGANFNFPDNPPVIAGRQNMSLTEIREAARFANAKRMW